MVEIPVKEYYTNPNFLFDDKEKLYFLFFFYFWTLNLTKIGPFEPTPRE
jgi:hypothetical protein